MNTTMNTSNVKLPGFADPNISTAGAVAMYAAARVVLL